LGCGSIEKKKLASTAAARRDQLQKDSEKADTVPSPGVERGKEASLLLNLLMEGRGGEENPDTISKSSAATTEGAKNFFR